jgi:hypothetical protein
LKKWYNSRTPSPDSFPWFLWQAPLQLGSVVTHSTLPHPSQNHSLVSKAGIQKRSRNSPCTGLVFGNVPFQSEVEFVGIYNSPMRVISETSILFP